MTDVVVVGGGVMGLATAWRLAEAGRDVVVLERSRIGHDRGSSHGPTRIFRYAYDHPAYVHLARASLPLWHQLENTPEELVRIRGGIDLGDQAVLERCAEAMTAAEAEIEWLAPEEARARLPWLEPGEGRALYSPDTGVIAAAGAVARLAERARAAGATLREETPARAVERTGSGARVAVHDGWIEARTVVVCAGAWAGPFLRPLGMSLPLHVTQEQTAYVEGSRDAVPVIWRGDRFFYTVPALDGSGTIKVAEHVAGPTVDPDAASAELDPSRLEPVARWASEHLPDAGPLRGGETCLYTMTPDEHFVIGARDGIVVVSACSGHGFKFAPLIGEIAAALATDREPPAEIDLFDPARFPGTAGDAG